jgi:hypothetical protein
MLKNYALPLQKTHHDNRANARTASGTPWPTRSGSIFGSSRHELILAASISAAVFPGCACIKSAASPATCGVAIEVLSIICTPPLGLAEMTSTPGAMRSETIGSAGRSKRWLDEQYATRPRRSRAPIDSASA